jgi:anti-sigma B factor antagonist
MLARQSYGSAADELLRCDVFPERESVRVQPVGSLDLATADVLDAQLEQLRAAGFRSLVIDLRRLLFMDSTGLRLLLRWSETARTDGVALSIVPGGPTVQRVFELTGTLGALPFVAAE